MKLLTTLIVSAGFVSAQVFHSDDDFYRFLENRQRMAVIEAQARAWAQARAAEQERREFEELPLFYRPQKWKLHDWER
jgi:hypothetical protein